MPKKGYKQTEEHKRKVKESHRNTDFYKNPEWKRKNKEAAQKRSQNPEWKRKNKEAIQKRFQNSEYRNRNKEMLQNLTQDPEWKRKNKEAAQKRSQNLKWRDNQIIGAQKRIQNPEWQLNSTESRVGGFCIQNIRYSDRLYYCELWCPDLWLRIDKAQNYKSILSEKTKDDIIYLDGKTRALFRHHVYWQKKACCVWDEDAQGYYAWINIGTPKKPNKIKYSKDKLKWIKIFEDLIETKLGGICYIPKDPSNNGDDV
jgi:hypothetical protein